MSVTNQAPSSMYRKLWTKLAPSTDIGQPKRTSTDGGRKNQTRYRSLSDQPNLHKIRKYINKRLSKKTQRRYVRNPVSSIQSLSARRQSGKRSAKSSDKRKPKRWYSEGYPALREANKARVKQQQELESLSTDKTYHRDRLRLQRKKSIYYDDDSDVVPYYRSRSVNTSKDRGSTYTPVTNEQDVIYQTYTGRDTLSHRRRPSSLPPVRSGSHTRIYKHVSPSPRSRHSISSLPSEKTYLASDKDMRQKHMLMRTNLVKMSQEHHRQKSFKVDRGRNTEYDDVLRDREQIRRMKQKYESAIMSSKRKNLIDIEPEFGMPVRVRPTQGTVYSKPSILKLDPIKHPVAPERLSKKKTIEAYIKQNEFQNIKPEIREVKHFPNYAMEDSEFETVTGTDYSTMETLSTAVMVPAQPTPDIERLTAKQYITNIKQNTGRDKHDVTQNQFKHMSKSFQNNDRTSNKSMPNKQVVGPGKNKSNIIEKGVHTNQEQSLTIKSDNSRANSHTSIHTDIKDNVKKTYSENNHELEHINGTIKSPILQNRIINRETVSPKCLEKATTGKKTTSVTFKDSNENRQMLTRDTPSSNKKQTTQGTFKQNALKAEDKVHTTNTQESDAIRTSDNISKLSRSNSSSKQSFNNTKHTGSHKNESKAKKNTNTRKNTHKEETCEINEENIVSGQINKSVNHSDLPSNDSSDKMIDNRNSIMSVDVNRKLSVEENTVEYEADKRNINNNQIEGAIHWKELVQKHVRQPSTGVVNGESRTVTEHESEVTTETTTGIRQWRDLVQKYLHNKNPTFGKSTDRYLLEADDDDDDDIDVFERARRKYKLNIESDEDSDDEY